MNDLIGRKALLKRLHDVGGCGAPPESWADGYDKAIDLAYGMAENAPTIDPVHAAAEALDVSPDHLRELAEADREGRVKIDPKALKCPKCGKMRLFPRIDWQYYYCYSCKTQFPREAAEAALEEREDDPCKS